MGYFKCVHIEKETKKFLGTILDNFLKKIPASTLSNKKWSVPNKGVTRTKQDISHTTMETQNQLFNPQNKEIYCNTPAMVYLVNSGGYYTYRIFWQESDLYHRTLSEDHILI